MRGAMVWMIFPAWIFEVNAGLTLAARATALLAEPASTVTPWKVDLRESSTARRWSPSTAPRLAARKGIPPSDSALEVRSFASAADSGADGGLSQDAEESDLAGAPGVGAGAELHRAASPCFCWSSASVTWGRHASTKLLADPRLGVNRFGGRPTFFVLCPSGERVALSPPRNPWTPGSPRLLPAQCFAEIARKSRQRIYFPHARGIWLRQERRDGAGAR